MTVAPDTLLLADEALGREFRSHLDAARLTHCTDPYEALELMSRRPWRAIVLAAEHADLPALCRASRRLQGSARVVAVCDVADEPHLLGLVGGDLDDYVVYPPSRADWQALTGLGAPAQADAPADTHEGAAGSAPNASSLTPDQWGTLILAARTPEALEEHLVVVLSHLAGAELVWQDQAEPAADALLRLPGSPDRVLVCRSGSPPAGQARRLARQIQPYLPALSESARRCEALHHLAITDHLTGACNRRYFYYITNQVLLRAAQRGARATLLLYDIDNFKRYNDTYGHAAGDEILRSTAALMRRITREQDIVARIGGDEFAVLFHARAPREPNSRPPETALEIADRFRQIVHGHEFPCLGPEAKGVLTISGGLASFPKDGTTCQALLRQADRALDEVKASGKNAVHLIGSPTGPNGGHPQARGGTRQGD